MPPLDRADVVAAYRLILGREPESEAVIAEKLRLPDLEALRASMLGSEEFRRMARRDLLPTDGVADSGVVSEAEVAAIYQVLLGRDPEGPHLAAEYRAAGMTAVELMRSVAGSTEYATRMREEAHIADLVRRPAPRPRAGRPGPLRLLLFGAYGNGNLGDAAQAEALARLATAFLPGPVHCAASSWLDFEAYGTGPAIRRAPDTLLDAEKLQSFDAVLFGGGGLLGPAHFPLHRPEWVQFLLATGLPYGFVGIGASRGVCHDRALRPILTPLLRGAAFVSVRDPWSVAAMEGLRDELIHLPDPVLAAWLLLGPPAPPLEDPPPGIDTLLIVKAPAPGHAHEVAFVQAVSWFARANPGRVRAVVVEPRVDRAIADAFPDGVEEVQDFGGLVRRCATARRVVSMRYHGAIAGILAGTPTLGGPAPKVRTLMAELGCPRNAVAAETLATCLAREAPAALPTRDVLDNLREGARAGMRCIAGALMAALGTAAAPKAASNG